MERITANDAVEMLKAGQPLVGMYIEGILYIPYLKENGRNSFYDGELVIKDCVLDGIYAASVEFRKRVIFSNTNFMRSEFFHTLFLEGLQIESCQFDDFANFSEGRYFKNGYRVQIQNNTFNRFADFNDCVWECEVNISNNNFNGGTNLLDVDNPHKPDFRILPVVENNKGQMGVNVHNVTGPQAINVRPNKDYQ